MAEPLLPVHGHISASRPDLSLPCVSPLLLVPLPLPGPKIEFPHLDRGKKTKGPPHQHLLKPFVLSLGPAYHGAKTVCHLPCC